jgi:protoporphyrinogen oxidase
MSLIHSRADDLNLSRMQSVSASSLKQPQNHVVIMGAGPAGLTAAYELVVHQHVGVTVLEKDPRYVGGISRTVEHDGYRFDIGGHRFFSKSTEIEDLWAEIMGNDLLVRPRLSVERHFARDITTIIKSSFI